MGFRSCVMTLSRITIEYWGEDDQIIRESDVFDDSKIEEIKSVLNEYSKPTKIEYKSIEEEIVKIIFEGLIWYASKPVLNEIRKRIEKIIGKKLPRVE